MKKCTISVIGLGYVGLPLAVALSRHFLVVGFEKDEARAKALRAGKDRNSEVCSEDLLASNIKFTTDPRHLDEVDFFIITVATPIDQAKKPDLSGLIAASELVGSKLKRGSRVVYESTVYPGVTEHDCIPVLERCSGLRDGRDFYVGYSPERTNPGEEKRSLANTVKIISAGDEEMLNEMERIYGTVVNQPLYKAPSIKVAEASKVIENIQRDLNIALMNEVAIICHKLGIDTGEVLKAAGTKWNFIPFTPGLVGGHCIGVDPYYLTHKAEQLGYQPQVILSGRRINDGMGHYIVQQGVKLAMQNNKNVSDMRALMLGFTFKENVSDIRNTRVAGMVKEAESFGFDVTVHDPCANGVEVFEEYGIRIETQLNPAVKYHLIIIAVAHNEYCTWDVEIFRKMVAPQAVVVDVKHILPRDSFSNSSVLHWRL
jgi:UDP-N-acetyl-D-glucosamine/UDP-N-acetyl-D-galactosamine dehydrogenase